VHTSLLLILSSLTASDPDAAASVYQPRGVFSAALAGAEGDLIVRGQSPYGSDPLLVPGGESVTTFYPQTYAPDATVQPYGLAPSGGYYPAPITSDPWLGGGAVSPAPYAAPAPYGAAPGLYTFGLNGPRPYKFGWTDRVNIGYLPREGTSNPNVGNFEIFEVDMEKEWIVPLTQTWVLGVAPQFNYRAWEGPLSPADFAHLPGSVYRFALNFKLATPQYAGWSAEFGFNPAIATDLESGLESDGVLFDAYGVAFWQWGPQWTWALGAAYWDRVDDIILPYAGFIYTPNDYWEFRLVFPQPRISFFLGTPFAVPMWAYVGAEYHVEAYQVDVAFTGVTTRVQYEDWRVFGGLRFETGALTSFIEVGGALAREVEFEKAGTDFEVDDGLFARLGLRW
jgi:hypothetical protein